MEVAREVASRITSVSTEAVESQGRAILVRENSTKIAAEIDQLRNSLVEVVKTSTANAA